MATAVAASEGELVTMLRARYEQEAGNGVAGAVISQVRNDAGFDAKRTLDAIAVSFWPSRGLLLEGFECKSSRSDWQRELKDPSKAEEFCTKLDRFWIVAGATGIVLDDELPPEWGLLVARGSKLVQVRPAKGLRDLSGKGGRRPLPPGFDRGFLIALLRQATFKQRTTPEEIEAARRQGFDQGAASAKSGGRDYEAMYERLYRDVQAFQQSSGISVTGTNWPKRDPKEIGAVVRLVLNGDQQTEALENRLTYLHDEAARIATQAAEKLTEIRAAA